ncbi:type II secretion system protein [Anaerorhabdus sp.]|uniref:type II secretion system protein n=1 Tax=Anaerorhabdus sp. TaxID=1872524 RepID=UPI002FC5A28C
MNKKINKKGFTLIELIVVIAILAVLGLLLVPQISGYITASKDAVGHANVKGCYSAFVAQQAAKDSKLTGLEVTVDPKCEKKGTGDKIDTVSWTDDTSTWTYTVANGEITKK